MRAGAMTRPLTAGLALQEHITNTLQKQLSVLQNEKQKLERELQHEHAEHAAAMSRLSAAFTEKLSERSRLKESFTVLENQLEAEQELIVHRMGAQARPPANSVSLASQRCTAVPHPYAHMQVTALLQERARLKRENERLRTELRTGVRSSSMSPAASPRSTPASSPRTASFRLADHPPPAALQ